SQYRLESGVRVLDRVSNTKEALRQLATFHPSLAIIGPNLTDVDSLAVCRALTARSPSFKVIICTALANDPLFQIDAVHAGAAACLEPVNETNALLEVIRIVLTGRLLFPR